MTVELGVQRIAVLGLGRSGRAALTYLVTERDNGRSLELVAFDAGDTESHRAYAAEMREYGVRIVLGATGVDADFDMTVASPGIPPKSPLLVSASQRSGEIISELEFAYRESTSPWMAITGTNGKTTTTSLITHLLAYAGVPARCVGNIGDPAIEVIDRAAPSTALIAEVSSFQLALTSLFKPRVAVLLNITPDHVDWHGSLEAYAADKARVFANQDADDVAIIDIDDPGAAPYAETLENRGISVVRISRTHVPARGAGVIDGTLSIDTDTGPHALVHESQLKIRGAHNVSNALAAAAAAHAWGVDMPNIAQGLTTFEPIEHRLEPVGVLDGVEYINDSKGTNPASTIMALTAFEERPLILLLGGRNKGSSFSELAARVRESARAAIVFGEAAVEIGGALADAGVEPLFEVGMADALHRARAIADEGDVVVLSPACASFDEFSSYAERGDTFRSLVEQLASAQGEST